MKFKEAPIKGVYIIYPDIRTDDRGIFFRTYCRKEFRKAGKDFVPVQTNESLTEKRGTVRGLHFQIRPHEEAKVVRCINGKVFDVVVDVRQGSVTYGKWISVELSGENHMGIYIPKGFAHGFQTLTDNCILDYFMSDYYSSRHAAGIRWNDPTLSIPWPIKTHRIMSKKDAALPFLADIP